MWRVLIRKNTHCKLVVFFHVQGITLTPLAGGNSNTVVCVVQVAMTVSAVLPLWDLCYEPSLWKEFRPHPMNVNKYKVSTLPKLPSMSSLETVLTFGVHWVDQPSRLHYRTAALNDDERQWQCTQSPVTLQTGARARNKKATRLQSDSSPPFSVNYTGCLDSEATKGAILIPAL